MYVTTFQKSVENEYLDFLKGLSEITDFYNFSGYNRISMDDSYYYETSHFTPQAADIIMDIMQNGGDEVEMRDFGFGAYVTKENADDFILNMKFRAYTAGMYDIFEED